MVNPHAHILKAIHILKYKMFGKTSIKVIGILVPTYKDNLKKRQNVYFILSFPFFTYTCRPWHLPELHCSVKSQIMKVWIMRPCVRELGGGFKVSGGH